MPQETIGTKNGTDFFVGQNANPADAPKKEVPPDGSGNPLGGNLADPNQIMSSMILPMYQNFLKSMQSSQDALGATGKLGESSIAAAEQASIASIKAQVLSGRDQFDNQQRQLTQQKENTVGALEAQQAAASGNTLANTAFFDQKASIQGKFDTAINQVSQARSLLQLQGTAAESAAHQKAAADLLTNAQNLINNTMQLAGSGLQAATSVANVQLQAMQYGLGIEQFLFAKNQYQDSLMANAKQFALDANIKTPAYEMGGTFYDTKTGQPMDAAKALELQQKGQMTSVDSDTILSKQYVVGLMNAYPAAKINPTDSITAAQSKVEKNILWQAAVNNSGKGTPYSQQVEDYAQSVFSGQMKLTAVPQSIRGTVATRVTELSSSVYDSEFDARPDYDAELQRAVAGFKDANVTPPLPSDLYTYMVNRYGKYISPQEIQGAVDGLYNIQRHNQQKMQQNTEPGKKGNTPPNYIPPPSPNTFSFFYDTAARNIGDFFSGG